METFKFEVFSGKAIEKSSFFEKTCGKMCIFAFEFLERKNGILPEPLCKGVLHLADMSGGVDLEDKNVPMV